MHELNMRSKLLCKPTQIDWIFHSHTWVQIQKQEEQHFTRIVIIMLI